jgi:hypothetical protein
MLIKNKYLKHLDSKFWKMLGLDIIAVYLHMGKQDRERATQWLALLKIKV